MSVLNGVKYTEKFVTDEELKVLELFKECEQARFIRYNEENMEEAFDFSKKLNGEKEQNVFVGVEGAGWVTSNKGKIEATAFLK